MFACICVLDFSKCLRLCVLYSCARTQKMCAFGFIVFVCSNSENVCVCVYCVCVLDFRKYVRLCVLYLWARPLKISEHQVHVCNTRTHMLRPCHNTHTHISPPQTIHTQNTHKATCKRTNTLQKQNPKRLQKFNPLLLQQITHTYTPTHTYTHIHMHTQTEKATVLVSKNVCIYVFARMQYMDVTHKHTSRKVEISWPLGCRVGLVHTVWR